MIRHRNLICNVIIGAFCLLIVAPVTYMLLDRTAPYEYLHGEIRPFDPAPSDDVTVRWRINVRRYCQGYIQRRVVDSHGVVHGYDATAAVRPDQIIDNTELVREFRLPKQMPSGPAKYSVYACYQCNPLQAWWPICVRTPEIDFMVRGSSD